MLLCAYIRKTSNTIQAKYWSSPNFPVKAWEKETPCPLFRVNVTDPRIKSLPMENDRDRIGRTITRDKVGFAVAV